MTTFLQVQQLGTPGKDIDAYISKIAAIPILTAKEELILTKKLFEEGDMKAAKKLVMSHLRFVVYVARGYSGYGLAQGDLIQEGNIGLMKAVKRFNPSFGVRMISFAVHWIKSEMHDYILRNWRVVKVATTKSHRKLFFNLRKSKKRLEWLTEKEIAVLAKDLNVSKADIRTMESRMFIGDSSFDPSEKEGEDSGRIAPSQYIEDNRFNPAEIYEQNKETEVRSGKLREALKTLDERSLHIIRSRWLSEEKKLTLHDLAGTYGVSAERIRQIENQAMKKIRLLLNSSLGLA